VSDCAEQGQQKELMTSTLTWFFVVGRAIEWENALKPGDRAILIEADAHAALNDRQCDEVKLRVDSLNQPLHSVYLFG